MHERRLEKGLCTGDVCKSTMDGAASLRAGRGGRIVNAEADGGQGKRTGVRVAIKRIHGGEGRVIEGWVRQCANADAGSEREGQREIM